MRKHKRSGSLLATKISKFNFDGTSYRIREDKRGNSVKGCSLLPLTLRPRLFGVGIVAGAVAIMGTCFNLSSNQVSAAVQATLTIPDNISANVNPTANGGFAEGTPGQVEVSTNNQAGYTLSIKSKDGTELKNGSNSLQSITTNLTADQYKNSEYYNTWGFKPDVVNSLANTNYIPSPSTSGIVLAKSNTNSLTPESFNLAIATKVDKSIAAGNYTNSFVLTATGNEARYNIKFDNNGGTGGPQAPQTDLIGDDLEVQIESETPSMEGKDFLGWCTKTPKEDGTCTGVVVQPGGCFPLCKCDLDITLYAMYGTKSSGGSGGTGSSAPSGTFSGMSNGTPCESAGYQGMVYAGLCWMNSDFQTNRNFFQAIGDCASIGWRLPASSDFYNLIRDNSLGSGSGLHDAGWENGDYWSSTMNNHDSANYLTVTDSSAKVNGGVVNYTTTAKLDNTFSVRCVAG